MTAGKRCWILALGIGDLQRVVGTTVGRVTNFCFVIEPRNAKVVESELRKRGLRPVAENDGKGFESFHVKDPDGWDLQISNGNGFPKTRKSAADANLATPKSFTSTGWKTM